MRIAYIKPEDTKLRIIGMKDTLENWHKLIECDCIEAHTLTDYDENILFICDESGKNKNNPLPNFHWGYNNDVVVGVVAFCSRSGADFASLDDIQINIIKEYLKTYSYYPMNTRKEMILLHGSRNV